MRTLVISAILLISIFCGSVEAPPKKVMIDVSHSLENVNAEVNTVALRTILPEFSFHQNNRALTENRLEEYNVVMVYQPYSILEDSEIQALKAFVKNGGGLIICGEHDVGWNDASRASYNTLVSTFGVTFMSNAIDDPTNKRGCYCTPVIHNFLDHPLTRDISQIVLFKPCSLQVSGNAVALARGDDDTYTVGSDEVEGEDVIVVAISEYGRGRVIVMGTNTAFVDSFINQPDNQEFSKNCFRWVSEQAAPEGEFLGTVVIIAAIIGVLMLFIIAKRK
jgi:uncharacterized membrane protein